MPEQLKFMQPIECEHDTCRNAKFVPMADYVCLGHYYCRKHIGPFVRFVVVFGLDPRPKVLLLSDVNKATGEILENVAAQVNAGALGPDATAKVHR